MLHNTQAIRDGVKHHVSISADLAMGISGNLRVCMIYCELVDFVSAAYLNSSTALDQNWVTQPNTRANTTCEIGHTIYYVLDIIRLHSSDVPNKYTWVSYRILS